MRLVLLALVGATAAADSQCAASNSAFHHNSCWCKLPCPAGQTRYGDGSACQGGGKPNCDLGHCAGSPNGFAPCVMSAPDPEPDDVTTTTAHPIPPLFPVGVHPLPKDTSLVPSAGVHPCSHVYCKAEKHKCSRFNTDPTTRMWDANAPGKRLFDPHKATCTGKSEHWSVRVFHHGKESVCDAAHGGHICGLGTFSGDRTKCECKPCTTCPRRTTTAAPSTSQQQQQQQQQQHPPIPTEAEQRCTWQDEGFGELACAAPRPPRRRRCQPPPRCARGTLKLCCTAVLKILLTVTAVRLAVRIGPTHRT